LQILDKLEGVFGNVYSSEALLQMFYMEKQQSNQTVADYGMKLESILQSAIEKGHISSSSIDEMLRSKFWFGLKDPLLQNAYQHIFDTVKDFDTLRREIRAIELNLSNSSANNAINTPTVQQNSISVESQKLTEVLKKLVAFNKRIDSMETELRELKVKDDSKQSSSARGSYNQGFNRGNPRRRWNGHRGQYGQGQNRGQEQNRNQGQYGQGQGQNRNQSQYGQGQGQNLNSPNSDLYERIVGNANETGVFINGTRCNALLDSGSMISTISDKMVRALNPTPEILQLDNFMLSINVASGAKLPYLGYVEVDLKIPFFENAFPVPLLVVSRTD
jgi:hypothetical protein